MGLFSFWGSKEDVKEDVKEDSNKRKQELEDLKYERLLIEQAEYRFNEWMNTTCWLMDYTRHCDIYHIYDSETARWDKEDPDTFRDNYLKKLQGEAISKAVYPEWFDKYYEKYKEDNKDKPFVDDSELLLWYVLGRMLNRAEKILIERKHFVK